VLVYVKLQSLPFFPQASTIAPVWSSSISYCDPGMVSFSCCSDNVLCDYYYYYYHCTVFNMPCVCRL